MRLSAHTLVRVVALDGALVPGACVGVYRDFGDEFVASACDADDGVADGVTRFVGLVSGQYWVNPTVFPAGAWAWTAPAEGTAFTRSGGNASIVNYVLRPAYTARVRMVNTLGATVFAGCLEVRSITVAVGEKLRCDSYDGFTDGVVTFEHLPAPSSAGHRVVGVSAPAHTPGPGVTLTYDTTRHAVAVYRWFITR